ncbi:MAG: glycosyltransferase family 2 protein [Bacteroidales bacterium]|nr:glycosyltransferase family 2 protein [Bacteroidales bacterium]
MIPRISVIIPVYNARDYLRRCLDSVLNQDFTDIEVILVDDGCTDESGGICDDYVERDSRITVYHKKNEGASLTRKYGLERAVGEYVTFIDSDDWVANDYLSKLYGLVKHYKVNVSACSNYKVRERSNEIKDCIYKSSLLSFDEIMPRFFKYEFWGFWGKIYLKSSLENLHFPIATLSEDYYVMAQLFNKERQIAYTEEPLYFYEYHENSLSHQKLSKRAFEEFDNVKAVYDYTKLNMPEYTDYALSNVVETCVKLYKQVNERDKLAFLKERSCIKSFLTKNLIELLRCKPLYYKVKIMAISLLFT